MDDLFEVATLCVRMSSGRLITGMPAYLVSEAGTRDLMIGRALDLYYTQTTRTLLLCDVGGSFSGYAGAGEWLRDLVQQGVDPADVTLVEGAKVGEGPTGFNTGTEAVALVRYCAQAGVRTLRVVAPSFHMPRVVVSIATAALNDGHNDTQFAFDSVEVGSWTERLVHSQGVTAGTVNEIFTGELAKISGTKRYQNLRPLSEVLDWLDSQLAL